MWFLGAAIVSFISLAHGHSWLSCPQSFDTNPVRGGYFNGPCEGWYKGGHTKVRAGDRLKVGWTSNNHAGGFVRLALVPEGQHKSNENFKRNVIKVACYGNDQRPGKTLYGDCVHPCNARPGCEYQADTFDVERYDTTITVPTNLKDGTYILQFASLVGNIKQPYYSCAKLTITGGNTGLNCASNKPPTIYKCLRSGGPPMSQIVAGIKRGQFCYHDNKMGEVDDRIREVPVNVDCDARITCDNSVNKPKCFSEARMKTITNAWNPTQVCGEVKPPPPPTCNDNKQNQGEENVDCGGPCKPCPTAPPNKGRYHSKIEHKIIKDWGDGFEVSVKIHISKTITKPWSFTIQYANSLDIDSAWGAKLESRNKGNRIYHFVKKSWGGLPKKGSVIAIGFTGRKQHAVGIEPLTMLFTVKGDSEEFAYISAQ